MSMVMYQSIVRWFLVGILALLLIGGKLALAADKQAIGQMLKSMADPAGSPFFPVVMQILQVLTWALHILFVYTSVGGLFVAIYGFTRKDENWQRLAKATLELAKVSVSLAIVLGVAPLLFYQVIYDPLWYSSANLSAAWYIMFIVLLLVGYYMIWGAYFMKGKPSAATVFSILGVIFLLVVGFIIHVVNYQSLYPEKWVEWYTSGGTTMNHSGWNIYAFNIFRFLSFLVFPAASVTGIFMMLYGWYFSGRKDMDQNYLDWTAKVGAKLALVAGVPWIVTYVLYVFTTPAQWGVKTSIPAFLSIAGLLVCAAFLVTAQKNPKAMAVPSLLIGGVVIILIAIFREYIRMAAAGQFGYSIYDYKVNLEWLSPLLFVGTTLGGLVLYAYAWWMAYRAGKTEKGQVYQAKEWEFHLGELSVLVVVIWAIVFIGTGLIIVIRNYT